MTIMTWYHRTHSSVSLYFISYCFRSTELFGALSYRWNRRRTHRQNILGSQPWHPRFSSRYKSTNDWWPTENLPFKRKSVHTENTDESALTKRSNVQQKSIGSSDVLYRKSKTLRKLCEPSVCEASGREFLHGDLRFCSFWRSISEKDCRTQSFPQWNSNRRSLIVYQLWGNEFSLRSPSATNRRFSRRRKISSPKFWKNLEKKFSLGKNFEKKTFTRKSQKNRENSVETIRNEEKESRSEKNLLLKWKSKFFLGAKTNGRFFLRLKLFVAMKFRPDRVPRNKLSREATRPSRWTTPNWGKANLRSAADRREKISRRKTRKSSEKFLEKRKKFSARKIFLRFSNRIE